MQSLKNIKNVFNIYDFRISCLKLVCLHGTKKLTSKIVYTIIVNISVALDLPVVNVMD